MLFLIKHMKSIYLKNEMLRWGALEKTLIVFFMLFGFIFLSFRNLAGQYPGLLDEYIYNMLSRLIPFSQAWIPNYLFYFLYRGTNACGSGFLSCVYLLNSLFYLGAFFPIYAITKKITSRQIALFVSILIICSPVNYWTAFFMPESSYFLFFWILIWALCDLDQATNNLKYLCFGVILGLGALIKVHALFLMPALIAYIYICNKPVGQIFSRALAIKLSLFLAGIVIAKYGLGWVLTGKLNLSIFGGYSSSVVSNVVEHIGSAASTGSASRDLSSNMDSPFSPINILKREAIHSMSVNVLPLLLFFGTPIAIIMQSLIAKKSVLQFRFFMLTVLVIACLVGIIQIYQWTMLAISQAQVELYWRYYEFALTLLLIAPAIVIGSEKVSLIDNKIQRLIIGTIVFFFMVLAIWNTTGSFWINVKISKTIFYCFAFGSTSTIVIWIFKPIFGVRLYLFLLLPLSLIASNVAIYKHLQNTRIAPNTSAIGALINSQLTSDDLKKVLVVQDTSLTQTVPLIFLNSPNLKFQTISVNDPTFDLKNVPQDRDWVILMGNHVLVGEALANTHMQYLTFGDMTLFGGHGSMSINFQQSEWPGIIKEHRGLFNPPEPWGAWSIDSKVVIKFLKPLPRKFDLEFTARAFGPNANRDIVVHAGDQSAKFQLPATFPNFVSRVVRIDNPNRLSEISIDIPQPISPKEMGYGDDDRRIGIGFSSMQIKW